MLYLGSIGMDKVICDCVIKGQFYRGIIGKWPFYGYNFFVKFHGKNIWEPQYGHVIPKTV